MRETRPRERREAPPRVTIVRTPIRILSGLSGQGVSHAETLRVSRAGKSSAREGQRRVRQTRPASGLHCSIKYVHVFVLVLMDPSPTRVQILRAFDGVAGPLHTSFEVARHLRKILDGTGPLALCRNMERPRHPCECRGLAYAGRFARCAHRSDITDCGFGGVRIDPFLSAALEPEL